MPGLASKIMYRLYPPRHAHFFAQRMVMNPSTRNKVSGLIASRLPQANSRNDDAQISSISRALEENGFAMMNDIVSKKQIGEIHTFLRDKKCVDRWRPEAGEFLIENASEQCHVAPYLDSVVNEAPHLLEIANHPLVLGVIEKIFGCKPTISQLGIWWSLTGHDAPEQAEFYHRDVDDWKFIKLFVYLTDVDEGSGPHKFIRTSQNQAKLLPIHRYTDKEVFEAFGIDKQMIFTGEAGTCFLENTFGFHKGQMPSTRNRLLFQAQYSLFPIGINDYSPLNAASRGVSLDPYINRLYVRT